MDQGYAGPRKYSISTLSHSLDHEFMYMPVDKNSNVNIYNGYIKNNNKFIAFLSQ
jgi:hypothetical protein